MITKKFTKTIEHFVYKEAEKYSAPSKQQIKLSVGVGRELARRLKADSEVVYLGTLLMDCQLGEAFMKGQLSKHVEMSAEKAEELLSEEKNITKLERENIINCVLQHHGSKNFYSIESEVVCNADCYKFVSIDGFLIGLRYTREMPLGQLIKLLSVKADEKWNALSLDVCRKNLAPQYKLIKKMIKFYKT
jgi:hypothetical protein